MKASASRGAAAKKGPAAKARRATRFGRGRACYWCGRRVDYSTHQRDPIQATREHIVPKSQFGSGAQRNITVACQQCNHTRGSRMDWVPYNELAKPDTVITAHQWAHLTMIFRLPAPVAAKKRPA